MWSSVEQESHFPRYDGGFAIGRLGSGHYNALLEELKLAIGFFVDVRLCPEEQILERFHLLLYYKSAGLYPWSNHLKSQYYTSQQSENI